MTPATPLLRALTVWPATLGSSPAARRAARAWRDDPVLARYTTPGAAALAVAGPNGNRVLAALVERGGEWTLSAAAAGLAGRLATVTGRWLRGGMPRGELEAAEADLVAECLDHLLSATDGTPVDTGRTIQAGWHRVAGRRRTGRAHAAHHIPAARLGELPAGARPERTAFETLTGELTAAVRAGTVSLSGAAAVVAQAAGWPTEQTAAVTGVSATALRAQRSRAVRTLAASLGEVA